MRRDEYASWERSLSSTNTHDKDSEQEVVQGLSGELLSPVQWRLLHRRRILPNAVPRRTVVGKFNGKVAQLFSVDQTRPQGKKSEGTRTWQ